MTDPSNPRVNSIPCHQGTERALARRNRECGPQPHPPRSHPPPMLTCPSPTDSRLWPTPTHVGPPRHERGPTVGKCVTHTSTLEVMRGFHPLKPSVVLPPPALPSPAPPRRPCHHRLPSRLGVRAALLPRAPPTRYSKPPSCQGQKRPHAHLAMPPGTSIYTMGNQFPDCRSPT